MNVQSIIHRPDLVIPDATIENLQSTQLASAVNIRLSKFTPEAGANVGLRSINGNELIINRYLSSGSNKTVGTCRDDVNGRIFFANWNSNGNHAIYGMNTNTTSGEPEIFPVLRWSGLNFGKDDYVSMAYSRGYIIWCCPTTEPRQLIVEKAVKTELAIELNQAPPSDAYVYPYTQYQFDQLRRPPLSPPGFEYSYGITYSKAFAQSASQLISNIIDRPMNWLTKEAYQFSYNYVYKDNSESRISEPSLLSYGLIQASSPPQPFQNAKQYLFVSPIERDYIIQVSEIQKIKWYIRTGNTGEWKFFQETTTTNQPNLTIPNFYATNIALNTYGITIDNIENLPAIGAINPNALLPVDGIAARVVDNIFADNRIIHFGLSIGAEFTEQNATANAVPINDIYAPNQLKRGWVPIKRTKQFMLVFYDSKGRIVGTKELESRLCYFKPQNFVNIYERATNTNLNEVWFSSNDDALSQNDSPNRRFQITPLDISPQDLPQFDSVVNSVGLAVKEEFNISTFLRTLVRMHYVFKDSDGKFIYGLPSIQGFSFKDEWNGTLNFYGVGFEFCSGEPINFSTEQNYYINIRNITRYVNDQDKLPNQQDFFFSRDFKITASDGPILISEQSFFQNNYNISQLGQMGSVINTITRTVTPGDPGSTSGTIASQAWDWITGNYEEATQTTYSNWYFDYSQWPYTIGQTIADIVLYSKIDATPSYEIIPYVKWTADEFKAKTSKFYLGDCFIVTKKATLNMPVFANYYFVQGGSAQKIPNYADSQTYGKGKLWPLEYTFIFSSVSENNNFSEDYSRDIGSVVVPSSEKFDAGQFRTYAHGEQFFEGSKINNWFSFNVDNRKTVSGNIGNIVKGIAQSVSSNQGENIYIHCTDGVEMVYIGRVQQTGTDGTGILSLSTNVFGTTNTLRLPYGPKKANHVTTTTRGVSYYFDTDNKVLVQLSSNGQDAVSEQRKFQTDALKVQKESAIGFDPFNTEIVVMGVNNGIAYNFDEDKYQGQRIIRSASEMFTYISSESLPKTFFGFYNGNIYKFLQGAPASGIVTINGEPIKQIFSFFFNHEINKNKILSFIRLLAEYNNSVDTIDWTVIVTGYDQGQLANTTIMPTDFVKRSSFYQATIKANESINKYDSTLIAGPYATITFIGDEKYKNLIFAEVGYTLPPAQ